MRYPITVYPGDIGLLSPSTWTKAPSFSGPMFLSWGCFESIAATFPSQVLHNPGGASLRRGPDGSLYKSALFLPYLPLPVLSENVAMEGPHLPGHQQTWRGTAHPV